MITKFWIVWSPESTYPPRVKYTSIKVAQQVSNSMAEKHGGTFYVMEFVGGSSTQKVSEIFPSSAVENTDVDEVYLAEMRNSLSNDRNPARVSKTRGAQK
ncbi:MAG: hypothetical protein ACRCZI_06260 [Cetobacterium sp.]